MSEGRESRRVWWIAGGVLALLVALRFLPEIENPLAPEPVAAHVALLAEGETVARDGAHELAAGRPFRLFAVLEARDWRGETVYFSEAPALEIRGRAVAPESHRRWPEDSRVKAMWFTVEGSPAYIEVSSPSDLARFRFEESFHPEWGRSWTVEGRIDPRLAPRSPDSSLRLLSFGTQRFAVRIEFFATERALTPSRRVAAPLGEAVLADPELGTRVLASLPPPLARLSASFGRSELAPHRGLDVETARRIDRLVDDAIVYVRAELLAAHLADAGVTAEALRWRAVDLVVERPAWGEDVGPGDLLQAGPRVVVLFRDEGEAGRLDSADLVFDLWEGLYVRRIDEIFRGDGGLALEHAALPRPPG